MHLARALTFITVALSAARHAKADCDSERDEMSTNRAITTAALAYRLAQCQGEDDKDCGVSDYKEVCENEGYDFYTYSANITSCDDVYYNNEATDVPGCLPKSCTIDGKLIQYLIDDFVTDQGCKVELDLGGISVDLKDVSAGFSRNIMAGGITLMLAGAGVALL